MTLLSKFNADIKLSCSRVDTDTDVILTRPIYQNDTHFSSDISKRIYFYSLLIDGEYHNSMQISNNYLISIYDWILTFTWYISLTLDFCYTVVKLHPKAETLTTAHCMA